MLHKCKMTILDKKLYPELQKAYCADPQSGPCPCYHMGDQYLFERCDGADDFWKMGAGILIKAIPRHRRRRRAARADRTAPSCGTRSAATSTPPCRAAALCAAG